MPLLANMLGTACFLLALIIATSLLLRRSYRYFGRKKKTKSEPVVRLPRPKSSRWSTNLDSPEQVAKFEVQMQETMRELSAQLDNKMISLQVLIRQANEKIAQLETLQKSMNAEAEEAGPKANPGAVPAGTLPPNSESIDPEHQQIYSLADQGFSAVTIAHRVSKPLSEIESVLREREQV